MYVRADEHVWKKRCYTLVKKCRNIGLLVQYVVRHTQTTSQFDHYYDWIVTELITPMASAWLYPVGSVLLHDIKSTTSLPNLNFANIFTCLFGGKSLNIGLLIFTAMQFWLKFSEVYDESRA